MLHEALRSDAPKELIAQGVDGFVFRSGGNVIKEYSPHISFEQVLSYEVITKRLATVLDIEAYTTGGVIAFTTFGMRYEVAPVILSSFDREKKAARSIARYIPGPRLSDYLQIPPISLNGGVKDLVSSDEKLFFQNLVLLTNEKGKGFQKDRELDRLAEFSRAMNQKLGIEGIKVSPADVKLRLSDDGEELIYVVTDLAPSITSIVLNKRKLEA